VDSDGSIDSSSEEESSEPLRAQEVVRSAVVCVRGRERRNLLHHVRENASSKIRLVSSSLDVAKTDFRRSTDHSPNSPSAVMPMPALEGDRLQAASKAFI
jgi:hypothetical protein